MSEIENRVVGSCLASDMVNYPNNPMLVVTVVYIAFMVREMPVPVLEPGSLTHRIFVSFISTQNNLSCVLLTIEDFSGVDLWFR